jgi:hypothetical protein
MKRLLSSILIIMALSSASYAAATKTEIIEEEVCNAVAGCWMNPITGECPECVTETRKVVTVIEDDPIVEIKSKSPAIIVKKTTPQKIGKKCWFAEAGWPTGELTDDFKPIMTGGYMRCSWRS